MTEKGKEWLLTISKNGDLHSELVLDNNRNKTGQLKLSTTHDRLAIIDITIDNQLRFLDRCRSYLYDIYQKKTHNYSNRV